MKFDEDAALVTYTVTMKGPKPQKDYHATIWAKRDGKWLGFHHQGTPAAAGAWRIAFAYEERVSLA